MAQESPFTTFRTFVLQFHMQTNSVAQDSNGNTVRVKAMLPTVLQCTLKASSDPRILALVGSDGRTVALSGRCVDPMAIPPGLVAGTQSPLVVDGVAGTFTLGPTWPSAVPEVAEAIGEKIVGTWRAG